MKSSQMQRIVCCWVGMFGWCSVESFLPLPLSVASQRWTGMKLSTSPGSTTDVSPTSDLPTMLQELETLRTTTLQSCPQLWKEMARINPHQTALLDTRNCHDGPEPMGTTTVNLTFAQVYDIVDACAHSLRALPEWRQQGDHHVAIFGENSARWLLADHSIQWAGGVTAVRGSDASLDELRYVYNHSDSSAMVVLQEPTLLFRLHQDAQRLGLEAPLGLANDLHGPVHTVFLLHQGTVPSTEVQQLANDLNIRIQYFSNVMEQALREKYKSTTATAAETETLPSLTKDHLSTIVYTSGTTGQPKGVMLTHGNLLHQLSHRLSYTKPYQESEPLPNETMLCLLPIWHITERTFELWMLTRSCKLVYSNVRHFRDDLALHQPEWLLSVPRVLERIATGVQNKFATSSWPVKALAALFTHTGSIRSKQASIAQGLVVAGKPPTPLQKLWSRIKIASLAPLNKIGDILVWKKVQQGFGGKLKSMIVGGSAMAGALEQFYAAAGFQVLVAYGLTECSPLLTFRRSDANLASAGCCGQPCAETEVRVVDPDNMANLPTSNHEERTPLPPGEVGVVIGRGPQVMKGYYKDPEATAKILDSEGWFDTGDLGMINPVTGDLVLTGRAKDTIVLSNGENIEPQPIEDALIGNCKWMEQVTLMGQDGRHLMGMAVVDPTHLAALGFLTKTEGKTLKAASDAILDPKCSEEEYVQNCKTLQEASVTLRSNKAILDEFQNNAKEATKHFRSWEHVSELFLTLEPFAVVNGQLTQSFKIKREAVRDRYLQEVL
eukprot:Nitzschia sp. Nitz4//scaffold53_size117307//109906//112242//NITZ4_003785-RA/size117307-processed-gene-0.142-mRNA-1//1//CDS//3329554250//6350//frame0